MIKYTDLELFCLKHIIRPYKKMMLENKTSDWCGHCYQCNCGDEYEAMSLDDLCDYIKEYKDSIWWKNVKKRLEGIDYFFPDYIHHQLLDLIKEK